MKLHQFQKLLYAGRDTSLTSLSSAFDGSRCQRRIVSAERRQYSRGVSKLGGHQWV